MKLTVLPKDVKIGDRFLGTLEHNVFDDYTYNGRFNTKILKIDYIDNCPKFIMAHTTFMPYQTEQIVIERQ